MSEASKDKSDKDESSDDTTMSLDMTDFKKRYRDLIDASESPDDDTPPEEDESGAQASTA